MPPMPALRIEARDPASRARAGVLQTAHGDVRTPAFVPLATKATVKGLLPRRGRRRSATTWCSATPSTCSSTRGTSCIAGFGGLHDFMGWDAADHHRLRRLPGLLDGPRHGRRRDQGPRAARRATAPGAIARRSRRRACASAPTSTARERFMGARDVDGGPGRACTPTSRSSSTSARRSTSTATTPRARPSARTAGSSAASTGTTSTARDDQLVYGIVQGGVLRGPARRVGASTSPPARRDGIAIGGSLGADKPQMYEVVDWTTAALDRARRAGRATCSGIGDIDDLVRGVELGIDTFDCAMPTRLGRHGMALVPDPEQRWRVDLTDGALQATPTSRSWRAARARRAPPATRAATCATSSTRRELTGMRLLTLHNLAFVARLMADLRGGDRRRDARRPRRPRCAPARRRDGARGAAVA